MEAVTTENAAPSHTFQTLSALIAAAAPAQGGHSAQHTMFLCHSPIFTSYSLHQAGSASPVSHLNL